MTTCATMLVALFQKQRQQVNKPHKGRCTCTCHTYSNKHKNITELNEMNDNKFFNCKCNHDCGSKLRKDKRKKTKKKKIVKFQIEHTGSMSSLQSPNRPTLPPTTSCDKLRNTLSLCKKLNGKSRTETFDSVNNLSGLRSQSNSLRGQFLSPSIQRSHDLKQRLSREHFTGKQHVLPR